ncbi:MAG: hypothetical protein K2Q45_03260 [Nitrosomonas sp.]|nr:hypothetical protein [Nitrosomonas sp.]
MSIFSNKINTKAKLQKKNVMSASINNRILAREFAKNVMKNITPKPEDADIPYLEGVIIEAVLFEEPMKQLEVSLNQVGSYYTLSIRGYENLINIASWANRFLGLHRDKMLGHVTNTYVQTTDSKVIMVIEINKMEFLSAKTSDLTANDVSSYASDSEPARKYGSVPQAFKKRTK